jgi:hypothetical protein
MGTTFGVSMGMVIFSVRGNIIGIALGTLLEHQRDLFLTDILHYDE